MTSRTGGYLEYASIAAMATQQLGDNNADMEDPEDVQHA